MNYFDSAQHSRCDATIPWEYDTEVLIVEKINVKTSMIPKVHMGYILQEEYYIKIQMRHNRYSLLSCRLKTEAT